MKYMMGVASQQGGQNSNFPKNFQNPNSLKTHLQSHPKNRKTPWKKKVRTRCGDHSTGLPRDATHLLTRRWPPYTKKIYVSKAFFDENQRDKAKGPFTPIGKKLSMITSLRQSNWSRVRLPRVASSATIHKTDEFPNAPVLDRLLGTIRSPDECPLIRDFLPR